MSSSSPQPPPSKFRWLFPYQNQGFASATATATAGRVLLTEFEVPVTVTIDQIVWYNGATVAGNVTVGIYGPIPTEETCLAAAVLYDSGDVAQSGASQAQAHTLSPTKTLIPGRYYVAIEFSDATATYFRTSNNQQVTAWGQRYDRGGGYGALTNACPAVTNDGTNVPGVKLRCVV